MDNNNYKKVPRQKNDEEPIQPNEIRITSFGVMRRYISYAVALLDPSLIKQFQEEQQQDVGENAEKFPTPSQQYDTIVLKAMGRAISKTVTVAEVIKRRVVGLHQVTLIHSTPITDEYEPKVEGLEKKTKERTVSAMTITLSRTQLDKKDPGYQEPIPADQVQPLQPIPHYDDEQRKKRPRRQKEQQGEAQQPQQQQQQQPSGEQGEQKKKRRNKRRAGKKPEKQEGDQQAPVQPQTQQQPQQPAQQGEAPAKQPRPRRPRPPREPREPRDQTQGAPAVATETQQQGNEGGDNANKGRGRGRGRGRRGGRGGRGRGNGGEGNNAAPTTTAPQ